MGGIQPTDKVKANTGVATAGVALNVFMDFYGDCFNEVKTLNQQGFKGNIAEKALENVLNRREYNFLQRLAQNNKTFYKLLSEPLKEGVRNLRLLGSLRAELINTEILNAQRTLLASLEKNKGLKNLVIKLMQNPNAPITFMEKARGLFKPKAALKPAVSETAKTAVQLVETAPKSGIEKKIIKRRGELAKWMGEEAKNMRKPPMSGLIGLAGGVVLFMHELRGTAHPRTIADEIHDKYRLDNLISTIAFNEAYEFSKSNKVLKRLKILYTLDVYPKPISIDTINKYRSLAVAYNVYEEQYKHRCQLTEKDWQEISANYFLLTSLSENLQFSATQYMIAYIWFKKGLNDPGLKNKLSFTDMVLTLDILMSKSKDKITFSNSENNNLALQNALEQIVYRFAQARLFPHRFKKIQRRPLD